ncbi:hypothetical protein HDV03_001982 [Kappamyces sp. JEL0829]|nr:hypothetical protein HDV03_001982 [Kappamyces sp. JEL0829]
MLNAGLPKRSGTLHRLKGVFGASTEFEHDQAAVDASHYGLYSICLSDSIRSLETLSPGLYSWIHSGEFKPKSNLRIFSPSGEKVVDGLPKHLTVPYSPPLPPSERLVHTSSEEQLFSVAPISKAFAESYRKQARKPVGYAAEQTGPQVKRFFLNVMELEFSKHIPNVEEVVCIITMAKQKRVTSCLPLYKAGKAISAMCMEAFLFDVPKGQGDLIVSVLIYSRAQQSAYHSTMASSPSTSSLNSNSTIKSSINFLSNTLKRSGTMSSVHVPDWEKERAQADAGDIGAFLGDLTIVVPSAHDFGKVHSWHSINGNKKNVGRMQVQMGIYNDVDYLPVPEVPAQFAENLDDLDFYLLTPGGLTWDKKWVTASSEGMFVYSHEWRDARSPIAWIPYKQLLSVKQAQREYMAIPCALELSIALPWKDDTKVFMPTPLSSLWKDQVVEAGKASAFSVSIYIAAGSWAKMERWREFLDCHISRHAATRR